MGRPPDDNMVGLLFTVVPWVTPFIGPLMILGVLTRFITSQSAKVKLQLLPPSVAPLR